MKERNVCTFFVRKDSFKECIKLQKSVIWTGSV